MDDLVRWLREQLDEDAARATAACHGGEGRWRHGDDLGISPARVEDERGETVVYDEGAPSVEQAAHVVAHDPARVLREIDTKRAILALHTQSIRDGGCQVCDVPGGRRLRPDACTTVRMLATVYADRPGYRDEWRP